MKGFRGILLFLLILTHGLGDSLEVAASASTSALQAVAKDLKAISFYRGAIRQLEVIAVNKRSREDDVNIRSQIIENYYRMDAVLFRLAHDNHRSPAEAAASGLEYKKSLGVVVDLVTRFAKEYSQVPEVGRMIFLRGKSYAELEKSDQAIADFKYFVQNFKKSSDLSNAEFSLNDLLVKEKQYQAAIDYLLAYQVKPSDPYYPLYLDRLAFDYFYFNKINEAIATMKREIAYTVTPQLNKVERDAGDLEKLYLNCVLFYFTGHRSRLPDYTIDRLIPFVEQLNARKTTIKALKYFGKLLRGSGLSDELETLKELVYQSNLDKNDLVDFIQFSMEAETAEGGFPKLYQSIQQLAALQKLGFSLNPATKSLTDAASRLQKAVTAAKGSERVTSLASVLISVDVLLLKIHDKTPAEIGVRFNLAEALYLIKSYDASIAQYRWIVEHTQQTAVNSGLIEAARLQSATILYEVLQARGLFPKNLKVAPIPAHPPELAADLRKWLRFVDECHNPKDRLAIEDLRSQANRLLYSQGAVLEAIQRVQKDIDHGPTSKDVVASISLVVDTYVVSERWPEVFQFTGHILGNGQLKGDKLPELLKALKKTRQFSYFKITETLFSKAQYVDVLKRVDAFDKVVGGVVEATPADQLAANQLKAKVCTLGANAALGMKDRKLAISYFQKIPQGGMDLDMNLQLLLTRGSLEEEEFDFGKAARDYQNYLGLQRQGPPSPEMRKKSVLFAYLSGDTGLLSSVLADPKVCGPGSNFCENYHLLLKLRLSGGGKKVADNADRDLEQGDSAQKALRAILALATASRIDFGHRLKLLQTVASSFGGLDPLFQLPLLHVLARSLSMGLRLAALEVRRSSPIALDGHAIEKRVHFIEQMEKVLQQIVKMPWTRFRVLALAEWSNLYGVFAHDFSALPQPEGLSKDDLVVYKKSVEEARAPFQKKTEEFKKQALELARNSGIEAEDYLRLFGESDADSLMSPDQVMVRFQHVGESPPLLHGKFFATLHGPRPWRDALVRAADQGLLGQVQYLIQAASDQKWLGEREQSLARGGLLIFVGAAAEGLKEFQGKLTVETDDQKSQISSALIRGFYGVRNKEKVVQFLHDVHLTKALDPQDAAEIKNASAWAGTSLQSPVQGGPSEEE